MPRQHKPKTRRHLCIALVEVQRFPNGILSALPITKKERRLMNVADVTKPGRTPRRVPAMQNNTTSRCIRTRSANVLKAAIAKSKLLGRDNQAARRFG